MVITTMGTFSSWMTMIAIVLFFIMVLWQDGNVSGNVNAADISTSSSSCTDDDESLDRKRTTDQRPNIIFLMTDSMDGIYIFYMSFFFLQYLCFTPLFYNHLSL